MKTTMTPLFSLVAAALLPWGYDAFVIVPPAAAVSARWGRVSDLQAAAPSVDEVQQRETGARGALLDSGGMDNLQNRLAEMRGSSTEEIAPDKPEPKEGAPVEAVAAAPPAKAVAAPAPAKEAAAPVAAAATPVAPAAPAPAPPAPAAPKAAPVEAAAAPAPQKKQKKKRGKKAAAKSDPGASA